MQISTFSNNYNVQNSYTGNTSREIPIEVLSTIFSHITSPFRCLELSTVSKKWNRALDNDIIWKKYPDYSNWGPDTSRKIFLAKAKGEFQIAIDAFKKAKSLYYDDRRADNASYRGILDSYLKEVESDIKPHLNKLKFMYFKYPEMASRLCRFDQFFFNYIDPSLLENKEFALQVLRTQYLKKHAPKMIRDDERFSMIAALEKGPYYKHNPVVIGALHSNKEFQVELKRIAVESILKEV